MCTATIPSSADEALRQLQSVAAVLAGLDVTQMPAEALPEYLRRMEQADAVLAAARGQFLGAFDAKDGHLADGQRTTRTWLVHTLRVTRGQAGEYRALQALAREHRPLLEGLRDGHALTKSVALQLAKWTQPIPGEFREQADEILAAAARAGAGLRAGRDLRGDPLPHRAARQRDRHAPGPGSMPGHDLGRGRGDPRRLDPGVCRDGPGGAGRAVSPGWGRRPADAGAAVSRCA
jgi:hypothetical protein